MSSSQKVQMSGCHEAHSVQIPHGQASPRDTSLLGHLRQEARSAPPEHHPLEGRAARENSRGDPITDSVRLRTLHSHPGAMVHIRQIRIRKLRLLILLQLRLSKQDAVRKQVRATAERPLTAILRQPGSNCPILQQRLP